MGARRYGIYLRVFMFNISLVRCAHLFDIYVNTLRQIPYLQVSMYYSVYYINKNQPFHKPKPYHIVENPINVFLIFLQVKISYSYM